MADKQKRSLGVGPLLYPEPPQSEPQSQDCEKL
jgi:hypothetical protein